MTPKFEHDDEVIATDNHGAYLNRGKIVGVAFTSGEPLYDVQPRGTIKLTERIHITESRLRLASGAVDKMIKAYSKGVPNEPKMIRDDL